MVNINEHAGFIWSIAEFLRGDYKQSEYGKVVLPLTVLRRLDCVLAPTKEKVLEFLQKVEIMKIQNIDPVLNQKAGLNFHNRSRYDFEKLIADPDNIAANRRNYINGFSADARDIIVEYFKFDEQIARLDKANLLYLVIQKFCSVDFHPDKVSNLEMGYIFEELIRKFSEISNETAGEHFTPREVIRLMVDLLFINDRDILVKKGIVKTIYDPACGTGGMLSISEEYVRELNPDARLEVFGQEINAESYAICKADMLIKGQDASNIKFGNSFSADGLKNEKFDYMLSNPPFGVEWKKVEKEIKEEADKLGTDGRFGAGLPRISDGSFLFLQHMISKMKPSDNGGSRIGIVFNGSPLFTGSAGSGESDIRKWIIEKDMLEAIVAMPEQLFYNTGIATYVWIVTNRKAPERKGQIQLINGVEFFQKMSRSLGNKRNEISDKHIEEITRIYGDFKDGEYCKVFDNEYFGYSTITVERPLRLNFCVNKERLDKFQEESSFKALAASKKKGDAAAEEIQKGKDTQKLIMNALSAMEDTVYKNRDEFTKVLNAHLKKSGIDLPSALMKGVMNALSERDETADVCEDGKGNPEPDATLRDTENVPLGEKIDEYFKREVLPHVPDAWIDEKKTKVGYEINFTKYFYKYKPLRSLSEIRADILALEQETEGLLQEVLK